jgi:hypothetical protein
MPLTLAITEAAIKAGSEKDAVQRISNSKLKHHAPFGKKEIMPIKSTSKTKKTYKFGFSKLLLLKACALTLMASSATPSFALDIAEDSYIYAIKSFSGQVRGFVSTSTSFHEHYRNQSLSGVDIFSHVQWESYYQNEEYVDNLKVGGYTSTNSIVPTGGIYDPIQVCFEEPIPVNAKILNYSLSDSYFVPGDVIIPSYRNDRMCLETTSYYGSSLELMIYVE